MIPALLLIDLQEDFLGAPELQPAAPRIVERASALLESCRRQQIPILHIWTTTHRRHDDRMPHWKTAGRWRCEEGTPGHATPPSLVPANGERIIHKQFFSAFGNPELEPDLRALKCDTLVLCGVHLHGCIRATALDAYQRGYRIWIAEDAVGSDDALHATITQRYLAQRAATFAPVGRVVEHLTQRADAPALGLLVHRSPRDQTRVLWETPIAGADEMADATGSARRAWERSGGAQPQQRAVGLHRLADALIDEIESLATQIAEEIGKPITMARAEVRRSAALLRATAGRADEAMQFDSGPGTKFRYQPLGVIGLITPWNNPLAIPLGKIAPALLYGNAVVWKPAPSATSISRRLLDLGRAAGWLNGAEGLVSLCAGDRSTACALASDPRIDGVTLSGSLQTGYALQEICVRRHVPFQGELGGNNAAIVWDDADIQHSAREIAAGAFGFAGQRCTANRRAIVAGTIFDQFLRDLERATAGLAWGDPLAEATVVGPVLDMAKRDEVAALLERTRAAGARVLIPHREQADYAELVARGAYHPPAIVLADDPSAESVQEETFGPVLVVQRAEDFDEALALTDGVRQGLVAALFSGSQARQEQFLAQARAGVLKLNRSTVDADATSPLGGWKASGVGPAEHGPCDREFFCRVQTIYAAEDWRLAWRAPMDRQTAVKERLPEATAEGSIVERFAQTVASHAERLAISSSEHQWTYARLDRVSDELANQIASRDSAADRPVALLMAHDAPLIAAILGVLKAGRPYVVLDTADPPARRQMVYAATTADLLITDVLHRDEARRLMASSDGLIEAPACDEFDGAPVNRCNRIEPSPDAVASIIFTSGSTSTPKGVCHNHRALLHHCENYTRVARLGPHDRISLWTPCSLAASTSSLWGALLNGAALFPCDVRMHGVNALPAVLLRDRLTVVHCVPSLFRTLAAILDSAPGDRPLAGLRLLRLGGESVLARDVDLLKRNTPPSCSLLISYSSTETGPVSMSLLGHDSRISGPTLPVGRPTPDMDVRIVDDAGRPLPSGEMGQIVVRSRYLAHGYWNDPRLTAERFVSDDTDPGTRCFNTGDLGSIGPDGILEHHGRVDARLKVRGHRVDPAEIESVLLSLDGVREAAVVGCSEPADGTRLVAYIGCSANDFPGQAVLSRRLRELLPGHMVPSELIRRDDLPRTAGGKIDRLALSRSATPNIVRCTGNSVSDGDSLTALIAATWQQVLGKGSVGPRDDFFAELGGTSLQAARVIVRLENALQRRMPLAALWRHPDAQSLAAYLRDDTSAVPNFPATVVQRGDYRTTPLFFLHGDVYGGGSYCRQLARAIGPDQPFYALEPLGLDSSPTPPTIELMASRFLAEVGQLQPTGPYRLGGFCNGGLVAYEMARRLELAGERVDVLALVRTAPQTVRWPGLRQLINGAAAWLDADGNAHTEVFVRVHDHLQRWKDAAEGGVGGCWRYGVEVSRSIPLELRRRWSRESPVSASSAMAPGHAVFTAHRRAMLRYSPGRYGGRVLVFWPEDEAAVLRGDPSAGWGRLAAEVIPRLVPGGHLTCVTVHAAALAEHLRRHLCELNR